MFSGSDHVTHHFIISCKINLHSASAHTIYMSCFHACPDCRFGSILCKHAHRSMVTCCRNIMVVTRCNTSNMKTSLQTSFIAGFTGSWSHMQMTFHIHSACIVFTASMTGINFRKRGKILIMCCPVLSTASKLICYMVWDSDRFCIFIIIS